MSQTQPIPQRTAYVRPPRAVRRSEGFFRTLTASSQQNSQTMGLESTLNRSASTPTLSRSNLLDSTTVMEDQSNLTFTPVKGQASTAPASPSEDVPSAREEQTTPNGYSNFVQRMRNQQANSTSVCTVNITASRARRRSATIDDSTVFVNSSRRIARKQTPYKRARSSSFFFIRRPKMKPECDIFRSCPSIQGESSLEFSFQEPPPFNNSVKLIPLSPMEEVSEIQPPQLEKSSVAELIEQEVEEQDVCLDLEQDPEDNSSGRNDTGNSSSAEGVGGSAGGTEMDRSPAQVMINAMFVNNYYTNCFCKTYNC